MTIKVYHLTTAHLRTDSRIFLKECSSLSSFYEVELITADGLPDESLCGVNISSCRKPFSRLSRFFVSPFRIYVNLLRRYDFSQKTNIVHFHDPELLIISFFLKIIGAITVFDAHEAIEKTLLSREWIHKALRPLLAKLFSITEYLCLLFVDGIVCATSSIHQNYISKPCHSVTINNYPLLGEFFSAARSCDDYRQSNAICYIGSMSRIRGIEMLVKVTQDLNIKLILAGWFDSYDFQEHIKNLPAWSNVDFRGVATRQDMEKIYSESFAGVIPFLPVPNHLEASPNKLYEYMSASLPVICSDFPLWRSFINDNKCGICFDPLNADDLINAINFLCENKDDGFIMGANGRRAVESKFSWEAESVKLVEFYHDLIAG